MRHIRINWTHGVKVERLLVILVDLLLLLCKQDVIVVNRHISSLNNNAIPKSAIPVDSLDDDIIHFLLELEKEERALRVPSILG